MHVNNHHLRPLNPQSLLGNKLKELGITNWYSAMEFVRQLPYGRNSSRSDFTCVLAERRGTCSTKHAFMKTLAEENDFEDVELVMIIYAMNETNTPRIAPILTDYNLEMIPEAHCILRIKDELLDLTHPKASYEQIAQDVLEVEAIAPEQVESYKVKRHREYLRKWCGEQSSFSFEKIWNIREKCIDRMGRS